MIIDGNATYGGPFDSYTIPYMEGDPNEQWHERDLVVERFDHDAGTWADDETIPLRIVSEEHLFDLEEQIEKANERIDELESYNVRLANESHEYQQRVKELDKSNKTLHKLMVSGEERGIAKAQEEMQEKLNKFAIEQKIEALKNTLRENSRPIAYPHGHNTDVVYSEDIKFDIEQLRKEVEK